MADIRCSNCGNDNPDFLDTCQFCQAPLKPDPMLHIGEEPTKKKTDELEEILPDWLKEARQQGKDEEAAEDVFRSQIKPRVPKEEPPDLLAGLMSQSESDEEEVPNWLTEISPVEEEKPTSGKEESSDFFAQFNQAESQPAPPAGQEASQEETSSWMDMEAEPSEQKDELTDWFSQTPAESATPFAADEAGAGSEEAGWMGEFGTFDTAAQEPAGEKEPEDLSWLHDLEAASKGTGDLPDMPKGEGIEPAPSSASDEDLSWLKTLGGTHAPGSETPAAEHPAASEDDLDWLNNLGGVPAPSTEEPAPAEPASAEEDLDWLNKLGGTPVSNELPTAKPPPSEDDDMDWLNKLGTASAPGFEEAESPQPSSEQDDDLSWLDKLGRTAEPEAGEPATPQPSSSGDDMDWLKNLGETAEPSEPGAHAFGDTSELYGEQGEGPETPRPFRTAPLRELQEGQEPIDTTPDWLKEAMQGPSMPAPGAVSMNWFSEHEKPADAEPGKKEPDETGAPTQVEPASPQRTFDFPEAGTAMPSEQDVNSLFDMEMPDWLSSESEDAQTPMRESAPPPETTDESLAPVELPSWVQAMRPVDSAIDESAAGGVDQYVEREGPLAGFQGVIPAAPIGSSLRPKIFSQKLQITEEQQAGASLFEQIIAAETLPQPREEEQAVSPQRILRWALSGLFLIVLSLVIGLGLQTMPILPSGELSSLVSTIPDASPVLIVVDYEPSFAGELEAAAGPLLDQLALSRGSTFTFVAMSPTGTALVDRLMFNTGVSQPDGLGYQAGSGYFNLGFLPGGSSGVLGFIEDPADQFSAYEAVILMTDNAETGRVWIEQLEAAGPGVSGKPLFLVSSAQSGPLLRPYVDSGQADILVNGLYDAARYEQMNVSRPGTARAYWDAFGIGLMMAVIAIVLGSAWSVLTRIREQRAQAEQG